MLWSHVYRTDSISLNIQFRSMLWLRTSKSLISAYLQQPCRIYISIIIQKKTWMNLKITRGNSRRRITGSLYPGQTLLPVRKKNYNGNECSLFTQTRSNWKRWWIGRSAFRHGEPRAEFNVARYQLVINNPHSSYRTVVRFNWNLPDGFAMMNFHDVSHSNFGDISSLIVDGENVDHIWT